MPILMACSCGAAYNAVNNQPVSWWLARTPVISFPPESSLKTRYNPLRLSKNYLTLSSSSGWKSNRAPFHFKKFGSDPTPNPRCR